MMEQSTRDNSVRLVDLRPIAFAGTNSLFINHRSIGKYTRLLADKWTLGVPIDLHIRELVSEGLLMAYLTVPFLSSVSGSHLESDIRGSLDCSRAVWTICRRAFFQDADLHALYQELDALTSHATLSPLAAIFAKAVGFAVSDQWTNY